MTGRRHDEGRAASAPRGQWAAVLAAVLAILAAACGGGETKPGAAVEGEAGGASGTGGAPGTAGASPEGASAPGGGAAPAGAPAPEAKRPGDSAPAAAPPAPAEPNRREVVLFFQRDDDDVLGPERRKILLTDSITNQARQIVSELIDGPTQEGLLPTIPKRTTILGLYLDRSGTAYLDLSEEFTSLHPGGSADEMATIFSVVDSLTYNLSEIKRVRFLIAGEERDTLKSHLDLRRAYLKDMSIVRLEDGV